MPGDDVVLFYILFINNGLCHAQKTNLIKCQLILNNQKWKQLFEIDFSEIDIQNNKYLWF